VWQWFQTSLTLASGAVTNNRELMRRPGFRPAVLPAVNVTTGLVHFLLSLPVLLMVLLLDRVALGGALVLLPIVIILQYAMTLGLAYLAATVQVTFRDTQHLLTVLLMLLFYLTPVLYQASAVPGRYQALYAANPMTHLLDAYRALLLRGQLPAGTTLLALGVFASVTLFIGYRIFARASSRFVDEL
jgi:lipopolysaccharide transport system permease protein